MYSKTWLQKGTPLGLAILGLIIGIGGAFGAAVFGFLIHLSGFLFYGHTPETDFITHIESMSLWQRLLVPMAGGFLVGIIFSLTKVKEAEGEGVPEVEEALLHRRGKIRFIVAPVKVLTAAITLGSGGSAGREGPVIQMGSAIGSSVSQFFKQDTRDRSLLLAAGAAAGIGATFGTPAGAVLFTIEILKHRPSILRSLVIILSAVTSFVTASLVFGHNGLRFSVQDTISLSFESLLFILLLGITSVFVAFLFEQTLSHSQRWWKKVTLPIWLTAAVGGLSVGVIGLCIPHIHEAASYPLMLDLIALESIPISFLIIFLLLKIVATSLTLGSGGSGGIFAPILLLGVITGSITTFLIGIITPFGITGASILIGMATMFAAAAHAPFTAILMVYEMTDNSALIIPLAVSCILASYLSKACKRKSVYDIGA